MLLDDGQVERERVEYRGSSEDHAGSAGGDLRKHGQKGEAGIYIISNENNDQNE